MESKEKAMGEASRLNAGEGDLGEEVAEGDRYATGRAGAHQPQDAALFPSCTYRGQRQNLTRVTSQHR